MSAARPVCGRDVWEVFVQGDDASAHAGYDTIKFKGGWERLAAKFNELAESPALAIAVLKEKQS